MKKVLVTGATGFLGKYIIEELVSHDYQVIAFGRNEEIGRSLESENATFFKGDLTDIKSLTLACEHADLVVHAGALSTVWGKWSDFYKSNVLGTANVLDVCRSAQIERLVYISSPSIYAAAKDQLAIKEDEAPEKNDLNYYIKSEIEAEKLFDYYPDVHSIILRPRGLFGIGDTSVLPRVISLSQKIGIPLIKDGSQLVDMTCVENVALAVRLALETEIANGQVYNITNGEPRTFKSLIEEALTGLDIPIRYKRIPASLLAFTATSLEWLYKTSHVSKEPIMTRYTYYLMRYSQTLDISKAEKELGYKPKISISEGITKYVEHYRRH